ncbi:MAG: TIM barrel protein, partial [Clostridia bacterium]|nr:TIM barrel protein [Clostridia bacterium]
MYLATTTNDFDRFEKSYLEKIKHVFEAGFSHIDLSLYTVGENDELFIANNWRNNLETIQRYADENGIKFVQAHGPNVNPFGNFQGAVKLTERAIEICSVLGIPNMVVHPGY